MMVRIVLFCLFFSIQTQLSAQLYENFFDETVEATFTRPIGITFDENGRGYVWEQGGKVFLLTPEGEKIPTPFINISEEVASYGDHGLLGFALDPDFQNNGYFYLAYVVDRHHLLFHNTPEYNPDITILNEASIGRVTRYQADLDNDLLTAIPESRKILLGETVDTGLPILMISHGVGALQFGNDGSLLLSVGEAGSFQSADIGSAEETYFQQALDDGILKDKENIGAFRAQMLDCMLGKILRLDPETGNGLPSNPYYEADNPRSPKSRVWALGFRNPYRFIVKPNTGAHSINSGEPGHLFVGDVGANLWEETSVVWRGGLNMGWPLYESYEKKWPFYWEPMPNVDAPNPLGEGCEKPYFGYSDLIQDPNESNTYSFSNPCQSSQSIPENIPTFVHNRPIIAWSNVSWNQPTRAYTPSYDANGTASSIELDSTASTVEGSSFDGYSSMPGFFYEGDLFPEELKGTFFQADYAGWIRAFSLNENYEVVKETPIHTNCKGITHLTFNEFDGAMYYINIDDQKVHRVAYSGTPPPVVQLVASQQYGTSPLTVQFEGGNSYSPYGSPLSYAWDFGDLPAQAGGNFSDEANPIHTFVSANAAPTTFTTKLTVTDTANISRSKEILITLNNTPPSVEITSFEDGDFYPINGITYLPLFADVRDNEHEQDKLSYAWTTVLHHNVHIHPEPTDESVESLAIIEPLGCQEETFWYRVELTVTDGAGLSSTDSKEIFPYCGEAILEFLDLYGEQNDTKIDLFWESSFEKDIVKFEIQRKNIQNQFEPIGELGVQANMTYTFTDDKPNFGVNTYRIKAIDEQGIYTYSNEIELEYLDNVAYKIYPNPTNNRLFIEIKETQSERVEFRVYDSLGKLVDIGVWQIANGNFFQESYLLPNIGNGIYFYELINGSNQYQGKFIVTK